MERTRFRSQSEIAQPGEFADKVLVVNRVAKKIKGGDKIGFTALVAVGKELAEKALKAKIKKVVFDRRGYAYHGRVRMVAEGAREGGLEF